MSIKSDRWIREMALKHGMIEPFVEKQVREGMISYGLSSYGYDIRVNDEFKIFTNVNTTIVDPKNFDSSSFVDIKAPICTIPPNSFVLSRTIEKFNIPRNVLSICIGKSSYARCFRGDTRVALVDGTAPTLEEMARRSENGELFWGYSIGQHGRIIVTLLEAPRYIGRDSLLEITLDNDEVIHCTSDHQFIMRDGRSSIADNLRAGDSLMPLYRQDDTVYQPRTNQYEPIQQLLNELKLRQAFGIQTIAEAMGLAVTALNHKIKSVRALPGDHDVYCLTVPEAGNFALEAGVFVHNCGLIVNVTPLEPEWSGYLTLEISNTTPLPARVYANEGIAQLLFFESDEVCEISYADRKGKYQDQVDITLPRL